MASKIDVYNMALAHIGSNASVADETQRSEEARWCNRFWDTCRDALLSYKDMRWRFATARVALADIGDPPLGWGYRYAYPNDCVNALEIVGPSGRTTTTEATLKFEIQYATDSRAILTDVEAAELLYTKRIVEVERWPSSFVEAMAYRLAGMIVMPLKNDMAMRNDLLQLAENFAQIAMAASLNEGEPDNPVMSIYEQELSA